MSVLESVHAVGAQVWVRQEGVWAYEARVVRNDGERYWVDSRQCPEEGILAEMVYRIFQLNMPGGDTYEAVRFGVICGISQTNSEDMDGPITHYTVHLVPEENTVMQVEPSWLQPL